MKDWFKDAKYGLFIHWGLYALLGGVYKGKQAPYGAEWIMKNAGVPLAEYRKLKDMFNPVEFDAEYVVKKAKEWGMKYIVFTAKHHDGFAMYDSKESEYNIMHTPYGKDVVKQLANACRKQDMIFCIYYSQMQDWEDENGWGNTWDFKPDQEKDFEKYFYGKVIPQVDELLSNYGDIGIMWFDTPYVMPEKLCRKLRDYVKKKQPNCLVSGRIGYRLGDYQEIPDNEIPLLPYRGLWETPMTLNDTWGYSKVDDNWKSARDVLFKLTDVVGKGGNVLLNIGPDEMGRIPEESCRVLDEVGEWLKVNGAGIYEGNVVVDFPYENRWGKITVSENKLYLHVFNYPKFPYEILVTGLKTKVTDVYLQKSGECLTYYQSYEPARDEHRFRVILPESFGMDEVIVVCAEYEGKIELHDTLINIRKEEMNDNV